MRVKWYTRSHQKLLSLYSLRLFFKWYIFFYFLKFILIGGKLLYNIVVVLPSIDMNQPWVYMCPHPELPSHLPPHPIPQGHPSAPALSTLSHASNLDWRSVSHMIIYMFNAILAKHPTLAFSFFHVFKGKDKDALSSGFLDIQKASQLQLQLRR